MLTFCRRSFLRTSTSLLAALIIQFIVFGNHTSVATAQVSATSRRPLKMLVLGDSVMWGQGNLTQNKFSYRLANWLCEQRNGGVCKHKEDVQIHVEAHSGAIISKPKKEDDKREEERFKRSVNPVRYDGEVNNSYPTVWGQIELARNYYAANSIPLNEVDLIIVNGGINDMDATRILLPRLIGGDVEKEAEDYCNEEMSRVLVELADTFPNARIVVPGYFPLISEDTPPDTIITAFKELFLGRAAEERPKLVQLAAKELLKELNREENLHPIKEMIPHPILAKLVERSAKWVRGTDNAYQKAVDSLNKQRPMPLPVQPTGGTIPAEASMRALFVPIIIKHAYAAKDTTQLWKLGRKASELKVECPGKKISELLLVDDDMQGKRPCMCDQAGRTDNIICIRAGAFHPNIKGQDAYFNAIKGRLQPLLAFIGWSPAI